MAKCERFPKFCFSFGIISHTFEEVKDSEAEFVVPAARGKPVLVSLTKIICPQRFLLGENEVVNPITSEKSKSSSLEDEEDSENDRQAPL